MINTEELKKFSINFVPNKDDIKIAYAVIEYFKTPYMDPRTNLGNCFLTVQHTLAKKYHNNVV